MSDGAEDRALLASLALRRGSLVRGRRRHRGPVSVPIEPMQPIEPLDNGLDQPVVAHPYLYTRSRPRW